MTLVFIIISNNINKSDINDASDIDATTDTFNTVNTTNIVKPISTNKIIGESVKREGFYITYRPRSFEGIKERSYLRFFPYPHRVYY